MGLAAASTVVIAVLIALLDKAAWWLPSWLDSILPNVDIEGEKLRRQLAADKGDDGADNPVNVPV